MVQAVVVMMNGNKRGGGTLPLSALFDAQIKFQGMLISSELPCEHGKAYEYHIKAMVEEMGELMKADKRWKTHRNAYYDRENKLEELADIFITSMNLSIFSGFTAQEISDAIIAKISENTAKLKGANEHDSYC